MEERKIDFSQVFFSAFIRALKELKIDFEQDYNPIDGQIYSWPTASPGMWGAGATKESSVADMLEVMRESAQILLEDFSKINLPRLPYILKILISTPEELKSCLRGPICTDI